MNTLKNERGVILVFVALGLLLFLLFLGVSLDTGWMVFVRSQGQARVDAAALAAASALINIDDDRKADAQDLADAFANSNVNMVVNAQTDPDNKLQPMSFNIEDGWAEEAASWSPGECNAVRVTNSIRTPLFFSGIRNAFGSTEGGSANINVTAVAYLGCPARATPGLPVMLCQQAITYPAECCDSSEECTGSNQIPSYPTENRSACANSSSLVRVGDRLDLIDTEDPRYAACLAAIEASAASSENCRIIPVVDCPGGQFAQQNPVVGFAEVCIAPPIVAGENPREGIRCGERLPGLGTGECFGVFVQNPILVQEKEKEEEVP